MLDFYRNTPTRTSFPVEAVTSFAPDEILFAVLLCRIIDCVDHLCMYIFVDLFCLHHYSQRGNRLGTEMQQYY